MSSKRKRDQASDVADSTSTRRSTRLLLTGLVKTEGEQEASTLKPVLTVVKEEVKTGFLSGATLVKTESSPSPTKVLEVKEEEALLKDEAAGVIGYSKMEVTVSSGSEISPFGGHSRPSPSECFAVTEALATLHGRPSKEKLQCDGTLLERRSPSVLDSLVRTILSQNTTDILSRRAFESLKQSFPTYKTVLAAKPGQVEVRSRPCARTTPS